MRLSLGLLLVLIAIVSAGVTLPRLCHWPQGGDTLLCRFAPTIEPLLLSDIDGAVGRHLSEVEGNDNRSSFFVDMNPPGSSTSGEGRSVVVDACLMLHIDFHLGAERYAAICERDEASHVSEWVCDSNDICFLRRYSRESLQEQVQMALARFKTAMVEKRGRGKKVPLYIASQKLSIPYMLLGEPPSPDFKPDLKHLDTCTSCWMTGGQRAPRESGGLDVGVRTQLLADRHAVETMEGLRRENEVALRIVTLVLHASRKLALRWLSRKTGVSQF